MTASRTLRISGLLIAVSALVLALVPYRAHLPTQAGFALTSPGPLSSSLPISIQSSCGPPVIEALRHAPADGGWFGYTPLTSTPVTVSGHVGCRQPARDRMSLSLGGVILAALLGTIAIGLDRRRGFGGTTDRRLAT